MIRSFDDHHLPFIVQKKNSIPYIIGLILALSYTSLWVFIDIVWIRNFYNHNIPNKAWFITYCCLYSFICFCFASIGSGFLIELPNMFIKLFLFVGKNKNFNWPNIYFVHNKKRKRICIMLPCCDDFIPHCAMSALKQKKENIDIDFVICDDSKDKKQIEIVNNFVKKNNCLLSRRPLIERGVNLKSGNLNYFLHNHMYEYDYFVTMDSDQTLSPYCVLVLLKYFMADRKVGLVQAPNTISNHINTKFSSFITPTSMSSKKLQCASAEVLNKYSSGYYCGHNAMMSKKLLLATKGFQNDITEDRILALCAKILGFNVIYSSCQNSVGNEESPLTWIAYRKRLFKWTYGDVKLFKKMTFKVLLTRKFYFVEKMHFLYWMSISIIPLLSFLLISLFLIIPFFPYPLINMMNLFIVILSIILGCIPIFLGLLIEIVHFLKIHRFSSLVGGAIWCYDIY